jgi:hypothetical protein
MDDKRKAAAQKLLDAAYEFWQACHNEGQYGAVQWLTDSYGKLLIFTRGEYRETLMANINTLPNVEKVHFFGENIEDEDGE